MPSQYSKEMKILFWIALLSSYILAIIPQAMAPSFQSLSGKSLHFVAFAVLTLLLHLSYRMPCWKSILYLLFYAVFIEFSQTFRPNRCAEILDIAADAIGIALGLVVYAGYKKLEIICANH